MEIKYVFVLLFLLALTYFWWKIFFAKKEFTRQEFSGKWRIMLKRKVRFYRNLNDAEKDRFEQSMLRFLDDVTITGVELVVDDRDRILVAASAVIPLFGFPDWRYRNLNEVLLYEGSFSDTYQTKDGKRNILGMVGTGAMSKMMILSKPALHQGFKNKRSKSNVGIHEFVHLLDMADGATDGIPEMLMKRQYVIPWLHEMHKEIKQIKQRKSNINPYGATNEAEFFSVASEYFFNQPKQFSKDYPELFELMEEIYRQDLA